MMEEMNTLSQIENNEPDFNDQLAEISTRYMAVESSEGFTDSDITPEQITNDLVMLTALEVEAEQRARLSPDEEKTTWTTNLEMVQELAEKLRHLKELTLEVHTEVA